jgi:ABC-type amino acid transport substrate-binding protein
MKRLTTLPNLLASILLSGLVLQGFSVNAQLRGDSFADAKSTGSANVMFTFVETPGFVVKEGVEVKGFCVEIMNEFAEWLQKEEGIAMKPVFYDRDSKDFRQFMDGVKVADGGVFGLGNITITEERKNMYNFSPPYITNIAILLTNKSVTSLQSLETIGSEFKGMTLVTAQGTLNEKRLMKIKDQYFPDVQIKYVPSSTDVLQELAVNEKAFSSLDFTYYLNSLQNRMPVKRHPIGDETSEDFGIIMPKNSDWAPVMARFMNGGFMESTEYRKLIANHLGQHALRLLDAVSVD